MAITTDRELTHGGYIYGAAYPIYAGHGLEGDVFDQPRPAQIALCWRANARQTARRHWLAVKRSPLAAATGLLLGPVRHKPYQRHGRRLHNGRLRKALR